MALPPQFVGLGKVLHDHFGKALRLQGGLVLVRAEILQHHDELVGTEAAGGVRAAGMRLQPVGDLSQQGVAGPVAQRVIDGLEVVQVDDEQGTMVAGPAVGGQGVLQTVDQQAAVRQTRDRVKPGQSMQLVLDAPVLGDIRGDAA